MQKRQEKHLFFHKIKVALRTLRRNSFEEALSNLLIVTTEEMGEEKHKQVIPFSEMSQAMLLWEVLQLQHCYPIC